MTHDRAETGELEPRRPVPRVAGQEPIERASSRAVIAVLLTAAVFLFLVRSILLPFVIAGAIAFVCTPLIERLARILRLKRWIAAVLVCCGVLAIASGLAFLMIPTLLLEIESTIANLQQTVERACEAAFGSGPITLFGQETDAKQLAAQVLEGIRGTLGRADAAADVAVAGSRIVLGAILTVVLCIYLMLGGAAVYEALLWLAPPRQRPLLAAILAELNPLLFRYFTGLAIVVVYATAAAYLGLSLVLHLPNAVMLAVLTGLLEIVPVVGPAASALIAGLFAIHAASDAKALIAYATYAIALRLSVDQLVSPLVLGRAGRIHPVAIIFSFLAGGTLFGIAGIVMAVPVALAIRTALAVLYEEPSLSETTPPASS